MSVNEDEEKNSRAEPGPGEPASPLKLLLKAVSAVAAGGLVFITGAYANAFAAFVLVPVVFGFFAVNFFCGQGRRAGPTGLLAVLCGNALVIGLLLSLLFLGFESYYRYVCDRTDAMAMTLVSGAWSARHWRTNSSGFRDNVNYQNALTAGRRRVTFVGDAFTAGYGLKNVEDRFANQIRRLHPDWEIHVAAKPGLDTSTEVELLHNLTVNRGYQVDQVVLVYQLNDIGELMSGWVEGYKKMLADPFRNGWLCQHSFFVNLFYQRWLRQRDSYMQKYYVEVEAAYKGPLWEREKFGLMAFANLTKMRGGRLLVVTFPYMDTGTRFQSLHEQLDRYWKEQGVPHLDLLGTFSNLPPSRLVVNSQDAHPNEFAHALAAKAIDDFLKRELASRGNPSKEAP